MSRRATIAAITLIGAGCAFALADRDAPERLDPFEFFTRDELQTIARLSPLGHPPLDPSNRVDGDPLAEAFGHRLFFDPGFSESGTVSCETCHDPGMGFAIGGDFAIGEEIGDRHAQSLWNVAYNRWFFWDGRVDTLWGQALGPFENHKEMNTTRVRVVERIASDPSLRAQYEAIFGPLPDVRDVSRFPRHATPIARPDDGAGAGAWASMREGDRRAVTGAFVNVGKAIASYERLLVSRDAPFDRFVRGLRARDASLIGSLDDSAMRGLKLFIGDAKCIECHSGPNFTNGSFHENRVAPIDGGEPLDAGRFEGVAKLLASEFNHAGEHSDSPETGVDHAAIVNGSHNWGAFKVPTLRNAELSPPYMHQGQFRTLRRVLEHYNTLEGATPLGHHTQERILTPLGLDAGQLDDLEAFLRALTDVSVEQRLLGVPAGP